GFRGGRGCVGLGKVRAVAQGGPAPAGGPRPRRDRAGRSGRARGARRLGGDAPHPLMSRAEGPPSRKSDRLVAVTLDEESIGRSNPDVEHERAVAIYDLLEDNTFE